jgi:hypothetical protein
VKIWKIIIKNWRKSSTCCKGVPGAMCCGKIYNCLRFGGILDPRVLCGQLLCAFISISALTHVVFSEWSFGPYGQASSRGQPNDGRNESFPCVHVWSGLCIAYPYPCWIVLTLFWWIDEVRCYTWPKTTLVQFLMRLFFQLLSDVWHRVASVVKKISLDRLQPEQIKQDDVKSFECYLFLYV